MPHLPGVRRVAGVLSILLLSACSGGGDSQPSRRTDISATSMAFAAASPAAATPSSQTMTATFGADVANVAVIHSGPAIAKVTSTLNGRTAQITIEPAAPSSVGAGLLTGTIAITGYFCADASCTRVEAGNSRTVQVNYQVSPIVNLTAPYVGIAGVSDTVFVRGLGFLGFKVNGVTFGATPATATSVNNDLDIVATYPALAAGSYPISLDLTAHQGTVTSTATLVIVDAPVYAAQALSYPAAITAVRSLIYDAERGALLVGTDASGGTLLRYPYSAGAWAAPASAAIPQLQDTELTVDGTSLLALTNTGITPVDPAALTLGAPVAAPTLATDVFLKSIAVAYNNLAIVTTGIPRSETSTTFAYNITDATFFDSQSMLDNATAVAPRNGAVVLLAQGDPSLTTAPAVYSYTPTASAISPTLLALNQNTVEPAFDRNGTRVVLNGTNVYAGDFTFFGTLPETTLAVAVKPDGTRAYTLDSAAAGILTWDISATNNGEALPQVGGTVTLAGDPGTGVKMTISPDGGTLFLAGSNQIVIQPTP